MVLPDAGAPDSAIESSALRYAGFFPRLISNCIDEVMVVLLSIIFFWVMPAHLRLVYSVAPISTLEMFYYVFLVKRFGATPGKLLLGLRIVNPAGQKIGYREAFIRYAPDFLLTITSPLPILLALSDVSFAASLNKVLIFGSYTWKLSELVVLLTNHKRRGLQDFLAGTVVIHGGNRRLIQILSLRWLFLNWRRGTT